ncbi:MAG: carboxypeptidase regulatory-like domain-containing protein [Bryobacteraceae bacterium]|nr:carboxypeptidase regulatory-like domain-containing protein [Bryobacteraceae bacterium]
MRHLLPWLFSTIALLAQVDTGAISGVVTDGTGAVIPNARIAITQTATGIETKLTTNATGFYAAPALRPGKYTVGASADGFRAETRTGIELRVQERLEISFQLEIGAAAAEVTVSATTPLLESETSSLGQIVEERTINDLPLNGRNFIQLATLGAGALPSNRTAERDNFIANGARAVQNSYLLDGVENKNRILGFDRSSAQIIQPVIEAIQEFKVQTSAFSAEFGQSAGGIVNVTLKSGTNDLHVTLFEYLRNSRLDALPYFQPTGGGRPAFIQNQFGATGGGPVRRNRTFVFGSWQSSREVNAAPQIGSVPLAPVRAGNFGTSRIYDPATTRANPAGSGFVRDLFANSIVPASRWDPVAGRLMTLYPQPNLPGAVRNHFYNPKERINNDQFNVRVDHQLGNRDSMFARVSWGGNRNTLPTALPEPANNFSSAEPTTQSVAVSETHTISPSVFNEFRFGFIRTRIQQQIDAPRQFEEFGIKGTVNDPFIRGLPQFSVTGLSSLGTAGPGALPIAATGSANLPLDKSGKVYQFIDNVSWIRGRHAFKFGGDIQQVNMFGYATNAARPNFNFNGVYTQNPQARAGSGQPLADFLLGQTNNVSIANPTVNEIRQRIFQGYAQDDWKVSQRLTLNIGVRYELALPFIDLEDKYTNFVLESGPLFGTFLRARDTGQGGWNRSLINADYNNFAPRVGLAYQATGKTVIRSAFGVFYGRDENIGVGRRLTNNPPQLVNVTFISDQLTPNIVLSEGFPADALDPARVVNPVANSYPVDSPLPYVLQWNLNIQQELPRQFIMQIGYTGSGARKLYYPLNVNSPPPGTGNVNARRPIQGVGNVFLYAPLFNSSYHALLLKAERRFSGGFSMLTSYTWGHSLDGGSSNNDQSDPGPIDPRNLKLHRGNSNFDLTHRFVASGVWELPFGKGKPFLSGSAAGKALLGGWQMSGIWSAQTGLPYTVTLNFDPTNSGVTGRPDRISDGTLPAGQRDPSRWFDLNAFRAPAALTYGNAGRNILRAPGRVNLDLGVARLFTLSERVRLQFRGEFFNLFNTPQFGLPGMAIGTPAAGIIGGVVTPERQIQLALKLSW